MKLNKTFRKINKQQNLILVAVALTLCVLTIYYVKRQYCKKYISSTTQFYFPEESWAQRKPDPDPSESRKKTWSEWRKGMFKYIFPNRSRYNNPSPEVYSTIIRPVETVHNNNHVTFPPQDDINEYVDSSGVDHSFYNPQNLDPDLLRHYTKKKKKLSKKNKNRQPIIEEGFVPAEILSNWQ